MRWRAHPCADDALLRQHRGMRFGGFDILGVKPLVDIDGGIDLGHDCGRAWHNGRPRVRLAGLLLRICAFMIEISDIQEYGMLHDHFADLALRHRFLKRGNARQFAAFEPFEEGTARGREIADAICNAGLRERGHGIAAAGHRKYFAALGRSATLIATSVVARSKGGVSNAPKRTVPDHGLAHG